MIVRRIAIVGAMILSMRRYYFMEKAGYLSGLSIGRTVLMEKLRVKCCLSIRRAVLMEKRWILMWVCPLERAYFVEEKEIAGRAGNDGKVGAGNDEKDQAGND